MSTDIDFYCILCKVDCIDDTGKLLHLLTEKHCVAYQSNLGIPLQNGNANLRNEDRKINAFNQPRLSNQSEDYSAVPQKQIEKPVYPSGNNEFGEVCTENNRHDGNSSQHPTKQTETDVYCKLCAVDCINNTGMLLHVLTEKHCKAYQLVLGISSQNEISNLGNEDRKIKACNQSRLSNQSEVKLVNPSGNKEFGEAYTENNRHDGYSSQYRTKLTDADLYCKLCEVDCVNNTGKLLHVLSEKHCEAYQAKLRISSQNGNTNLGNEDRKVETCNSLKLIEKGQCYEKEKIVI